jgi:hypothetical protein
MRKVRRQYALFTIFELVVCGGTQAAATQNNLPLSLREHGNSARSPTAQTLLNENDNSVQSHRVLQDPPLIPPTTVGGGVFESETLNGANLEGGPTMNGDSQPPQDTVSDTAIPNTIFAQGDEGSVLSESVVRVTELSPTDAPSVAQGPDDTVESQETPSPSVPTAISPTPQGTGDSINTKDTTSDNTDNNHATTSKINQKGEIVRQVECTNDPPSDASSVESQLVQFEYDLYIAENATLNEKIEAIDFRIIDALVEAFIGCTTTSDAEYSTFGVHGVKSLPLDKEKDSCESNGSLCYLIDAGFTLYVYYWNQRRLNDRLEDHDMVELLGTFMRDLFDGDQLKGGDDEIYNLTFHGFTNMAGQQTFGGVSDENASPSSGVAAAISDPSAQAAEPKKVGGSMTLVIAGIALMAVVAVIVYKRRSGSDQASAHDSLQEHSSGSARGQLHAPGEYDEDNEPQIDVLSDREGNPRDEGFEIHDAWEHVDGEPFRVPRVSAAYEASPSRMRRVPEEDNFSSSVSL